MFSDYTTMLSWLFQQPLGKSYPDLTHIERVLHDLGNPHLSVPIIHVAGTNGKGSTTAYLSHILRAHQKDVATFTSPHLHSFNERFQLNHQSVSNEALVSYMKRLEPYGLSQFELFTCAFFLFIADEKPDVAIVEAGIGGLLDTTNVVVPDVSIITSIGLDHIQLLGNTIEDITQQKAGIIKQNTPIIVGHVSDASFNIIADIASSKQASLYRYSTHFLAHNGMSTSNGIVFDYEGERYTSVMLGEHQIQNATVALKASQIFLKEIWRASLAKEGVCNTVWAGRMEKVQDSPIIYIDGAHNEQGIIALVTTIKQLFGKKKVNVLFGALNRKDYAKMVMLLHEASEDIYVTQFNHPQSITRDDIQESDTLIMVDDWREWVTSYRECNDSVPLIVTGSLYFISDVREYFMDK